MIGLLVIAAGVVGLTARAVKSVNAAPVKNKAVSSAKEGGMGPVLKLRPMLLPIAQSLKVPVEFLMAWIRVESGGRISSITNLGERGYFQIMPGKGHEAEKLGMGVDKNDPRFVRLSTDPEYSLAMGAKLVKSKIDSATTMLARNGVFFAGDDFLKFVKLQHGGVGYAQDLLQVVSKSLGRAPESWNEFYTEGVRISKRGASSGLRFSPATSLRVLENAQRTGAIMQQLRETANV